MQPSQALPSPGPVLMPQHQALIASEQAGSRQSGQGGFVTSEGAQTAKLPPGSRFRGHTAELLGDEVIVDIAGAHGVTAAAIPAIVDQLKAHGMVALGERREITPDVCRAVLEAAL